LRRPEWGERNAHSTPSSKFTKMTQLRLPAKGGFDLSQLHGCCRRLLASERRASRSN
jgi:hypothetical protein